MLTGKKEVAGWKMRLSFLKITQVPKEVTKNGPQGITLKVQNPQNLNLVRCEKFLRASNILIQQGLCWALMGIVVS